MRRTVKINYETFMKKAPDHGIGVLIPDVPDPREISYEKVGEIFERLYKKYERDGAHKILNGYIDHQDPDVGHAAIVYQSLVNFAEFFESESRQKRQEIVDTLFQHGLTYEEDRQPPTEFRKYAEEMETAMRYGGQINVPLGEVPRMLAEAVWNYGNRVNLNPLGATPHIHQEMENKENYARHLVLATGIIDGTKSTSAQWLKKADEWLERKTAKYTEIMKRVREENKIPDEAYEFAKELLEEVVTAVGMEQIFAGEHKGLSDFPRYRSVTGRIMEIND